MDSKIQEIKDHAVHTKQHDFFTEIPYEHFEWLIEQAEKAEKYQKLHEAWFKGIEEKEDTIFFLRKCKEVIEDFEIPTKKAMT